MKTDDILIINSIGRKLDKLQIVMMIVFEVFFVAVAMFFGFGMILTGFSLSLLGLLAWFGFFALFIPCYLLGAKKTQKFESCEKGLMIRGNWSPFGQNAWIDRAKLKSIFFGHPTVGGSDQDRSSVCSLRLIHNTKWGDVPVELAPLLHPKEKRQVFEDVCQFLKKNCFEFEVMDEMKESEI